MFLSTSAFISHLNLTHPLLFSAIQPDSNPTQPNSYLYCTWYMVHTHPLHTLTARSPTIPLPSPAPKRSHVGPSVRCLHSASHESWAVRYLTRQISHNPSIPRAYSLSLHDETILLDCTTSTHVNCIDKCGSQRGNAIRKRDSVGGHNDCRSFT